MAVTYAGPFYGDYHEYDVDLPPKTEVTPAEELDCHLGVKECARHRWERKRDEGPDAPDHPDVHHAGAADEAAPCGSGERWRTLNAADVTCAGCAPTRKADR